MLASKGIFAKFLYARGLDFETVVSLRAVLAIPGFILIAMLRGGLARMRGASWSDLRGAAFAGLVCYYFGAGVNFYALTLIDASVERALLFTYPALVVIATWFISGNRPGPGIALAVIATYVGTALTIGAFNRDLLQQNLAGAMLVLVCSATIAYYFIVSGRLTRTMGSAAFTLVAMTVAGTALAVHYQIRHGWQNLMLDTASFAWMIALAVFATVLPLYLVAEGVRLVGAQRAAISSTVGPPATAVMAILLLGETVSASQLAGIALIVGSILALEMRRSD